MIHGNRRRFAVEWELDDYQFGHFLEGTMCFWSANTQIGDYVCPITLSTVLVQLRYPAGECGKRRSDRFCSMNPNAAFLALYRGLYGDDADPAVNLIVEDEMWSRFDVSINVEGLDVCRLFLVDCESDSRLLVGQRSGSGECEFLVEQRLSLGEYDAIIKEFHRELEAAWELNKPA